MLSIQFNCSYEPLRLSTSPVPYLSSVTKAVLLLSLLSNRSRILDRCAPQAEKSRCGVVVRLYDSTTGQAVKTIITRKHVIE
jgi:hypothetical protein